MPCLQADELRSLARRIFEALQVPTEEAAWVAELLVRADLAGHESHGVTRLPQYVQAIRSNRTRPGARFEIVRDSPALALIDGHWGLGQVVARGAMELAIRKAKDTKIASVGAYHLSHVGRLADYTRMAAEQDLVGIMTVNAGGTSPLVAPFGGQEGRLGTNPLSIAFPTGGTVPFVLDMSTSVVAAGRVRVKAQRGEQTPEGWLIDAEGRPTTDPSVLDREPRGAMLPLGGLAGHKGFGLAMVVEVLSGILARGGFGGKRAQHFSNGTYTVAIDISAFVDPDEFYAEIADLLAYVKTAPTAPGVTAIVYPGEPEALAQQQREREGIAVDDVTWRPILALARELGVDTPPLSPS
jgi:LDH2 family malate/lactate/ureidoglycolate dehydrogenase